MVLHTTDYLQIWAEATPSAAALIGSKGEITFESLHQRVSRLANYLENKGIDDNAFIAYSAKADSALITQLAIMALGATSVRISREDQTEEINFTHSIGLAYPKAKQIEINEQQLKSTSAERDLRGSKAPAIGLFTSGTSGRGKLVIYKAEVLASRIISPLVASRSGSINLYGGGTMGGFAHPLRALTAGEPSLLMPSYDLAGLEWLLHKGVSIGFSSISSSVGNMLAMAKAAQRRPVEAASIRKIFVGGAKVSEQLQKTIESVFPNAILISIYGSTEVGVVGMRALTNSTLPRNCIGMPLTGVSVRVVDENGTEVSVGTTGRVEITSKNQAEYLNQENQPSFFPGDLGHLDTQGRLFLEGRESEVINSGGNKIDPTEIDEVLLSQPGVIDAAAFGFETKQGLQVPVAAVVINDDVSPEELLKELKKILKAKSPMAIYKTNQIPRNEMQKPIRRLLSEKYAEQTSR